MAFKKLTAGFMALALMCTLLVAGPVVRSSAESPSTSSQGQETAPGGHRHPHGFNAMSDLSKLTGMSEQQLMEKYPQKTAWQIAKSLGKLDELKKSFLETKRAELNELIKEGKLTADQAAKIYTELNKRVAAIDGVNTVIVGRPMPQKRN